MIFIRRYIFKRLLQLLPILLGITLLSFGLMLAAGDYVDVLYDQVGGGASAQTKETLRAELGLDRPFAAQYAAWLSRVLRGDMGTSYVSGQPVLQAFLQRLPATIALTASSVLLTVAISIPLGVLAAVRQNQFTDYLIRLVSFAGNAMPGFFLSLLLIYLFSIRLGWLPVITGTGLQGLILPTVTLAAAMAAKYTRQVRAAVLEEMGKEYVQAARGRGIRERTILFCSVLKASMLTIVTLLGLSVGSLLGGTAIVESIFLWDGVGKMAVDAILMRDYPVIQAYVMWMAVLYVLVNLGTDLLYRRLDPRIRLGREAG